MGGATSRVTHTITRPIKEYNLYDRAHKAVVKNKYVPSPKHPSTQQHIQKTIDELPAAVKDELSSTDASLEERLRQVYVTSQDIAPQQPPPRQHPDRPLPLDRGHYDAPEYGFVEPKVVPYGKVSLKKALQFITAHKNDPDSNTADTIALKHKLDLRLTEQVLHHFGTFRLFVPPQQTAKQQEMLKRLTATPTAIPNTADMQRRLKGVALSDANHETLPLHRFPEPTPEAYEATLMHPAPSDELLKPKPSEIGIKDTGMNSYVGKAESQDDSSRQSSNDVTQAKSDKALGKDKNADAT